MTFLKRKETIFWKGNTQLRQPRSPGCGLRNAKEMCDEGKGVGPTGFAVYLDFKEAIQRDVWR